MVEFVVGSLGAKGALLEATYADADHFDAYTAFYAHSFADVSKVAERLHFFAKPVVKHHIRDGTLASREYLGFVVLRPLQQRRIGRAVLEAHRADRTTHFPIIGGPFDVNVAGTPLTVTGAAFVEQDARVAACASSAIWMSTTSMARWLGFETYSTTEITELATSYRVGQRALPSSGLFPDQMAEALRSMGYDPMTVSARSAAGALEHIYPYIESGISPVLLLELVYGGHAVAGVGHTFNTRLDPPARVKNVGVYQLEHWRSDQWVDGLMRFLSPDPELLSVIATHLYGASGLDPDLLKPKRFEGWTCPVFVDLRLPFLQSAGLVTPPRTCELANLDGAIVPLPQNISLEAAAAQFKASQLIGAYFDSLGESAPPDLYTRTYLVRSNEFKARMSATPGVNPVVRDIYRGKPMPKWVWVTEVALRSEALTADPANARIRGEVVLDANGNPWVLDYVALHMPVDLQKNVGYVTTMMPQDRRLSDAMADRGIVLVNDPPYPELHR